MAPDKKRSKGFRSPKQGRSTAFGIRAVPLLGLSQTQELAKQEFARARRYQYPLTIGVCRVDRIDQLTDLYGAESRSLLMEEVARLFNGRSRSTDIVGRLGEDRLLWVLPHTDLDGSRLAAERIREAAETIELRSGRRMIQIGISVGLACYVNRNTLFFDSVLMQAQEALQRAQDRGGNQIEWHPLPEVLEESLRRETAARREKDLAREESQPDSSGPAAPADGAVGDGGRADVRRRED